MHRHVCQHVHRHVCQHVHRHVCQHVHRHVYRRVNRCVHSHAYTDMRIDMRTHMDMCAAMRSHARTCVRPCVHTWTCAQPCRRAATFQCTAITATQPSQPSTATRQCPAIHSHTPVLVIRATQPSTATAPVTQTPTHIHAAGLAGRPSGWAGGRAGGWVWAHRSRRPYSSWRRCGKRGRHSCR